MVKISEETKVANDRLISDAKKLNNNAESKERTMLFCEMDGKFWKTEFYLPNWFDGENFGKLVDEYNNFLVMGKMVKNPFKKIVYSHYKNKALSKVTKIMDFIAEKEIEAK